MRGQDGITDGVGKCRRSDINGIADRLPGTAVAASFAATRNCDVVDAFV